MMCSDKNTILYAGEYYDAETGNIYLRARYYDPGVGRFITEDPIKDGGNWYVYCGGNPVALVDPMGLAPGDVDEDSVEILSSERKASIAAITEARSRGYLSREEAAQAYLRNGVRIEKFAGITAEERGDTITITVHVTIDNQISSTTKKGTPRNPPPGAYKAGVIDGMQTEWSGSYKGKRIVVQVIEEKDSSYYNVIGITLSEENGPSISPAGMASKTTILRMVDENKNYSPKEFGIIAAHELGHTVFGLPDVYKMPEFEYSVVSIMNRNVPRGMKYPMTRQGVDFALISGSELLKNTSIYTTRSTQSILREYKSPFYN